MSASLGALTYSSLRRMNDRVVKTTKAARARTTMTPIIGAASFCPRSDLTSRPTARAVSAMTRATAAGKLATKAA